MRIKKYLALLLAGTMMLSMAVVASAKDDASGSSRAASWSGNSTSSGSSSEKAQSSAKRARERDAAERRAAAAADAAESRANALAAEELGLSMATLNAAAQAGKSVGEFTNNAVTVTHGLENATPVAQGGGVIIDGVTSNQSFTISKAVPAKVDSAKAQAAAVNGTVLNVVDVDGAVSFGTATVNFYTPGITGSENIQVLYLAGDQWTPVTVKEVRADHVVVDMTDYGILAFIQVP